ncbi:MAG: glycosyltransferase family 2 protein [Alphaproteobacteria bacterium]|nr:glycosyltransferase family 2 protein [Alphaproteobacteria bacterium]
MRLTKLKNVPLAIKLIGHIKFPNDFIRRHGIYDRWFLKHKKDTKQVNLKYPVSHSNVPVFVISFNRLSYVKQMVEFLEKYGFKNIHIVDNQSSYEPLLEYLRHSSHHVHFMDKNYGHRVVWESGFFDNIISKEPYIVTDPDIQPNENLPHDFYHILYQTLISHPYITKVGFALDIFNLPDNEQSMQVKKWESKFWEDKLSDDSDKYWADIDTTFGLYRPGKNLWRFYDAIRIGGNFTARHLPWHEQEESAEKKFYADTASASASWIKNTEMYE